jgi:hypothetical protein|nr:MAG TPA: hypothetical protein [Caudoviricetes sp.]
MKKTNTVTNTNTITDSIKIVGKKVEFVINNDENTELTEKATVAFIEWLKTSFNSRKYTDTYGIVAGGWCIDLSDVTEIYHIGTAYDSITGGTVEMVYLKFENRLLNRIVYLDSEILKRGTILLPIDGIIQYIPFSFKYINGTRKRTTKKSTTTQKSTPTKTSTKTSTNTTEKSKKVEAK